MADQDRRAVSERRQRRRGGRRADDAIAVTPLALVVTPHDNERARLQLVLHDLGFAVALCDTAMKALQAAREFIPDVILADVHEGVALRGHVPPSRRGSTIPIVDLGGTAVESVLSEIQLAFRRRV